MLSVQSGHDGTFFELRFYKTNTFIGPAKAPSQILQTCIAPGQNFHPSMISSILDHCGLLLLQRQ